MTALLTPDRPRTTARPTDRHADQPLPFPSYRPAKSTAPKSAIVTPIRPGRPALVVIEGGKSSTPSPSDTVYLRRRLGLVAVGLVVVVLLWGLVALGSAPVAHPLGTAPQVTSTRYVVRPGDTLWGIAKALDAGGDIRDTVDRLAAVNGSDTVFAGEAIRVPADLLR